MAEDYPTRMRPGSDSDHSANQFAPKLPPTVDKEQLYFVAIPSGNAWMRRPVKGSGPINFKGLSGAVRVDFLKSGLPSLR
jgi:hypothetical protein